MDQTASIDITDRPWGMAILLGVVALTSGAVMLTSIQGEQTFAALCAAAVLVGCVFATIKGVRFSRVTLHPDGSARYAFRDIHGWQEGEVPSGCLRAGVEHHRDGEGVTGRVMLLIDGAEGVTRIPFTGYFASPERAETTVARIMAWREATGAA